MNSLKAVKAERGGGVRDRRDSCFKRLMTYAFVFANKPKNIPICHVEAQICISSLSRNKLEMFVCVIT